MVNVEIDSFSFNAFEAKCLAFERWGSSEFVHQMVSLDLLTDVLFADSANQPIASFKFIYQLFFTHVM